MKKSILFLLFLTLNTMAIEIGKVPIKITLADKSGGDVNGNPWDSSALKGKFHLVLYMDPDKRKNIEPLLKEIKALKQKNFTTVAIVNLAATWMPNSVLMSKLKKGQKNMKNIQYVFDKKKLLVKKWGLEDDNTVAMVFDQKGKLVYKKTGPLSSTHIRNILAIIEK